VEAIEIPAKERSDKGTRACKRARKEGFIPACIYDHTGASELLLDSKEFLKAAEKSKTSQIFLLKGEGKFSGQKVIVKEIQKDFVKNKLLHVDLYRLNDNQPAKLTVPLKIEGEAPGVKVQSGILVESTHKINVKCMPKNIPSVINVDISNLNVGQRIKTGDIALPDGVVLRGNPNETVVSVISGRSTNMDVATETTTAVTAEGATGTAAPAAAASADAKDKKDKK
jgi:large subunit ribosomal protein L25